MEQHQYYQMINISKKRPTNRMAIAMGTIQIGQHAFKLIQEKAMPKGDPLMLAEIAGINGAKRVCEQLVLCHPIELEHVSVKTKMNEQDFSVTVYTTVSAYAKTGVEMEALAAVNGALLAIYDITKNVEPALTISEVRLLIKTGGKQGQWKHPAGVPVEIENAFTMDKYNDFTDVQTCLVTVSDRASNGIYEDESGQLMKSMVLATGANVLSDGIVQDDRLQLTSYLTEVIDQHHPQLVLLTGGTGLSPRDITPEVIAELCDKSVPGISELLRFTGSHFTPYSYLSRSFAGLYRGCLLIALPGNPKAIKQGLDVLLEILPHALKTISEVSHDTVSTSA